LKSWRKLICSALGVALPGLSELPRPADGVPGEDGASVTGGDHECVKELSSVT
jgi:hypothetical protein